MDGESFLAYVDQILAPTLQPGDIVIADNLPAHHVDGVDGRIAAAGAELWYLPPYSPDFNPIELCFAKLKTILRAARVAPPRPCGRYSASASNVSPPPSAATISATAAAAAGGS